MLQQQLLLQLLLVLFGTAHVSQAVANLHCAVCRAAVPMRGRTRLDRYAG